MLRHVISALSLPRFIMPCPSCGGLMLVTSIDTRRPDLEDITHSCSDCGCEVTRIVETPDAEGS
jgi:predicted RNA-binding Zn-ribbon protein involved in translation (DUF1610 family)